MSKKEDAAFKEWMDSLKAELEDSEHEALEAWGALPIAKEVFRGTIGQKELYRRMNLVADKAKELEQKETQLNEWWETNAPLNEELLEERAALLRERDVLRAQAGVPVDNPPPSEGTGVKLSKDELNAIKANAQKAAVLDNLLPSVLGDLGRVVKDSLKNDFDVDPSEVIQLSIKQGIPAWSAYLNLTSEEREKRAVTAKEAERKQWYEEGRKAASTNSPDHFQPSGPSVVDFLQQLNKGKAAGGMDPMNQSDRIGAALKELQEGSFSE